MRDRTEIGVVTSINNADNSNRSGAFVPTCTVALNRAPYKGMLVRDVPANRLIVTKRGSISGSAASAVAAANAAAAASHHSPHRSPDPPRQPPGGGGGGGGGEGRRVQVWVPPDAVEGQQLDVQVRRMRAGWLNVDTSIRSINSIYPCSIRVLTSSLIRSLAHSIIHRP